MAKLLSKPTSDLPLSWLTPQVYHIHKDRVRDELRRLQLDLVSWSSTTIFWDYLSAECPRNKHKDHWKPFDRKNPPKFMVCGEIGIDDKRKLVLPP
jgi:hypothetical protein